MIDFNKQLQNPTNKSEQDPLDIYESLDRQHDKGELRQAQQEILTNWFNTKKQEKDVVIKLHTGEGKTLIGLLIAQSKLNEHKKPVVYVCLNHVLVEQTLEQARQFGIEVCRVDEETNELPIEFKTSKKILVTVVDKVFNGKTQFGLHPENKFPLGCIILDDSHACIEKINETFTFSFDRNSQKEIYSEIFSILEDFIKKQNPAVLHAIKENKIGNELLAVPYWVWDQKKDDISKVLIKNLKDPSVGFTWELVKNTFQKSKCFISNSKIQIRPYLNPIYMYKSFHEADHRIFMSATTNNDSSFIKDIGIDKNSVLNPLINENKKWSGEKMILVPENIDIVLNRKVIMDIFSKGSDKFGVVALAPNYKKAYEWESFGATILSENIKEEIQKLKNGEFGNTKVIVNRYDGIDLPDQSCRILIVDSLPYIQDLSDNYESRMRPYGELSNIKIAQKVEQGFGRGVRGEKDYSIILIIGNLGDHLLDKKTQKYFSNQTLRQVEIGHELSHMIAEDIEKSKGGEISALEAIINQSLGRESGWKKFYAEKMENLPDNKKGNDLIELLEKETEAELAYLRDDYKKAAEIFQKIIDEHHDRPLEEIAWYQQEMARVLYPIDKENSVKIQKSAHRKNIYLFKTEQEIDSNQNNHMSRERNIVEIITNSQNYNVLLNQIEETINNLHFSLDSDDFEMKIKSVGYYLGFESSRPEKRTDADKKKGGPDNLWKVEEDNYLVIECKNESQHGENKYILKRDTQQLSGAISWFKINFPEKNGFPVMITSRTEYAEDASPPENTRLVNPEQIASIKEKLLLFYRDCTNYSQKEITEEKVSALLKRHKIFETINIFN